MSRSLFKNFIKKLSYGILGMFLLSELGWYTLTYALGRGRSVTPMREATTPQINHEPIQNGPSHSRDHYWNQIDHESGIGHAAAPAEILRAVSDNPAIHDPLWGKGSLVSVFGQFNRTFSIHPIAHEDPVKAPIPLCDLIKTYELHQSNLRFSTDFLKNPHQNENYITGEGIGLRGVLAENNLNLSSLNFKLSARRRAQVESGRYYDVLLRMNAGNYVIAKKTLFESPHRLLFHSNTPRGQYAFVINEAGEILIDTQAMTSRKEDPVKGAHIIIGLGYPAQFAGEIEFDENGFIVAWNNKSGTYQFPNQYTSETVSIGFLQQAIALGLPSDSYSSTHLH